MYVRGLSPSAVDVQPPVLQPSCYPLMRLCYVSIFCFLTWRAYLHLVKLKCRLLHWWGRWWHSWLTTEGIATPSKRFSGCARTSPMFSNRPRPYSGRFVVVALRSVDLKDAATYCHYSCIWFLRYTRTYIPRGICKPLYSMSFSRLTLDLWLLTELELGYGPELIGRSAGAGKGSCGGRRSLQGEYRDVVPDRTSCLSSHFEEVAVARSP